MICQTDVVFAMLMLGPAGANPSGVFRSWSGAYDGAGAGRECLVALSPTGKNPTAGSARGNWARVPARTGTKSGLAGAFSAHQRALESQLKRLNGARGACEHDLDVLGGLQERVGSRAVGGLLLAAEPGAQIRQPPAQALEQMIKTF